MVADYFCLPSGSGWALGAQSYRKDLHWKVLLVFLLCHSIAYVLLGLAENLVIITSLSLFNFQLHQLNGKTITTFLGTVSIHLCSN